MSAELDALLDAIRENPEDDLPRLALADWCQEQADAATQARGEFIQMRCRAASLPLDHPERSVMEGRANKLRLQFERDWLGGLATLLSGWEFERGCVLLAMDSERSLPFARLRRVPEWRWVIGLRGMLLDAPTSRQLLGSSDLAGLALLSLRDCQVGPHGAESLTENANLDQLAVLHLDYCGLGSAGVTTLSVANRLTQLTVLTLANNGLYHLGCSMLAKAANYERLTHLDLSRNPIGLTGVRALATTSLQSLHELSLCNCDLTDQAGSLLVGSSRLARLRCLDLRENRFSPGMIAELRDQFGDRVRL